MSKHVPAAVRRAVRHRAQGRCEYCLLHEKDSPLSHEVDHIIPRKHGGGHVETNLAWACYVCNGFRGADLTSIDTQTGQIVRLFNPREDQWSEHFRLAGGLIQPLTAKGRATEYLLQLNLPDRVQLRVFLIQTGRYPR